MCAAHRRSERRKANATTTTQAAPCFRVQSAGSASREKTTIHHNGGGGGSALFSLMDCRLLRDGALWCGQEELWESAPRKARGGEDGCVCVVNSASLKKTLKIISESETQMCTLAAGVN